uniref:NADH:ubiquinone reductase (H(+)-translocating) n=1 Tax=Dicyema japonicum TaxID=399803 RepID=A0A3G1SC04_DICJA|nr:NADH dehydrogenase subunit 5 [Dicyema japonicum]
MSNILSMWAMSFMVFIGLGTFSSHPFVFEMPLVATSLSILTFSVISCIVFSVLLFSVLYMGPMSSYFYKILFFFIVSMVVVVFSPSILTMYLGWEGLGFSSFSLIAWYNNSGSISNAMLTLFLNRVGDAILMLSIGMCVLVSDPLFLGGWSWLLAFPVLAKSACWPFSPWLPAAMSAPTPVSALVHSSTLVAAGVYLLLMFPVDCPTFLPSLSLFTIYLSSFCALVEMDFKRVVALSTMSQISMMVYAASSDMIYLAFFHLLTHAVTKACLFVSVGHYLMQGPQDVRSISMSSPMFCAIMVATCLSLVGFPFMSCFYSKDPMGLFIPLLLTSAYAVRLLLYSHSYTVNLLPIFSGRGLLLWVYVLCFLGYFLSVGADVVYALLPPVFLVLLGVLLGWSQLRSSCLASLGYLSFLPSLVSSNHISVSFLGLVESVQEYSVWYVSNLSSLFVGSLKSVRVGVTSTMLPLYSII